jgi:hypothetical protein
MPAAACKLQGSARQTCVVKHPASKEYVASPVNSPNSSVSHVLLKSDVYQSSSCHKGVYSVSVH